MKNYLYLFSIFLFIITKSCSPRAKGKHLFILSGQSNMQRLKLEESFTPTIEAEFGKENVIIVKDAKGGEPIRRWYKNWKPKEGNTPEANPDLYSKLINKVNVSIKDEKIKTVTFIWMQGERDAKEKHGEVYEKSLLGLYKQLSNDINRNDMNFIIGRLSDFDMNNEKYEHWTMVREAQLKVANSNPRFSWVNTDDLNDGENRNGNVIHNDLHMSAIGYKKLGSRFAEKAAQIINNY
ncbi:sialate O-acetylesterase [Cellulophaga baltica]|uniref:sialate O-acetylesterase n=1 Tax=Cellulophaga TaxID=104264 RepID=UPI001C079978|nr:MULTISPECIES: sialate O-acetylesterase [Cellulophaga]MBU2996678.1 sialate O-acetylesterase [Cellulophaga baltica]MDO6768072.1 sialate O-acetylesterase [Cellulophaga sp. 1_MG-2023]